MRSDSPTCSSNSRRGAVTWVRTLDSADWVGSGNSVPTSCDMPDDLVGVQQQDGEHAASAVPAQRYGRVRRAELDRAE
ncbi:MAG TPA: hypothetical protein VGN37_19310 [Actinocatenispora sp.]